MSNTDQLPPRRGAGGTQAPPSTAQRRPPVSPPKEEVPGRKKAILELIGAACIPLAAMASVQHASSDDANAVSPFAMDIFIIQANAEPIADAVVGFANNYPVLGAVLDKVAKASGLGGLVATVMTVGLQIAENHGKLAMDAKLIPGVTPREEMAQIVLAEAAVHNGDTAS